MHPANSVIIFTTLSGMGFGLMAWLGLGLMEPGTGFIVAWVVALALASGGLIASTFHLGNPQRAWRAFSQWRSSWLSREGVLSVLTLALFFAFGASFVLAGTLLVWLGIVVAALAVATVGSTAMIYAQLKTVPRWHSPITPICYLLFAAAGAALWATFIGAFWAGAETGIWFGALGLLVAAWAAKLVWWAHADKVSLTVAGSTPETATGLGAFGRVNLLEAPHSSPNYLMKEMVFHIGRKHARKLRMIAFGLGAFVPGFALLLFAALGGGWPLAALALVSHGAGVFAERWLFFAEAEHVVSLYYGHR